MTANRESAEDEWNNLEVPAVVEEQVELPADQDVPVIEGTAQGDVPVVEGEASDVPVADDAEGSN